MGQQQTPMSARLQKVPLQTLQQVLPMQAKKPQYPPHESILKLQSTPFTNSEEIDGPLFIEQTEASLQELLEQRFYTNRLFTFEDVRQLLLDLVYGLAHLQAAGIVYPDITRDNIFYVGGRFKFLPPELVKISAYERLKVQEQVSSPELLVALRCLESQVQDKQILNKTNVFLLGLIGLQCSTLLPSRQIFEQGNILQDILQERLKNITKLYPQLLAFWLGNMLDYDFSQRMDPVQFSIWIYRQLEEDRNYFKQQSIQSRLQEDKNQLRNQVRNDARNEARNEARKEPRKDIQIDKKQRNEFKKQSKIVDQPKQKKTNQIYFDKTKIIEHPKERNYQHPNEAYREKQFQSFSQNISRDRFNPNRQVYRQMPRQMPRQIIASQKVNDRLQPKKQIFESRKISSRYRRQLLDQNPYQKYDLQRHQYEGSPQLHQNYRIQNQQQFGELVKQDFVKQDFTKNSRQRHLSQIRNQNQIREKTLEERLNLLKKDRFNYNNINNSNSLSNNNFNNFNAKKQLNRQTQNQYKFQSQNQQSQEFSLGRIRKQIQRSKQLVRQMKESSIR